MKRKGLGTTLRPLVIGAFLIVMAVMCGAPAAAISTGKFKSEETAPGTLTLHYENADVTVTKLENGIYKIELTAPEIASDMESYSVVYEKKSETVPSGLSGLGKSAFSGGFGEDAYWFEFYEENFGIFILTDYLVKKAFGTEDIGNESSNDVTNKVPSINIPEDGIRWQADGSYEINLQRSKNNHYLGVGEPLIDQLVGVVSMDARGQNRPIWNSHEPPSSLSLPYVYIPEANLAVFIDNPWKAEFDFTGKETVSYRAQGGPLRFYIIPGDAYEVLDRFTELTGRPPVPPRWVTGYMQSQYGYINEEDFRWLMDNFRQREIPADTLIFDLDWFGGRFQMGDLWWGENNFPDGPAFMDELDSRGFKAITIVEPFVFEASINHDYLKDQGMFSRTPDGEPLIFPFWSEKPAGLMDFTNPVTRGWFAGEVSRIHDSGVDAWWTDLNEPEKEPEHSVYFRGPRVAWHNLQGLLMNMAMYDMYQEKYPDERLFIMSRSGFAGIQRFGSGIWSGDVKSTFHHLENQIPVALASGLSGLGMWNSDVGGFHGAPTPELYVRWIQFGAFCPVMRPHGSHNPREPWMFGDEAERINKKYIELRYRLAPYLYSLFHEMHKTGAPVMRPTFMEFPEDSEALLQEQQFLYGPLLLVAPVAKANAKKKKVYLPEGDWTYYWDERTVSGPREVAVPVDLETMPLFVRAGALLPMGPLMQYTGEKPTDPLTVHYYPAQDETTFTLYEDDGATRAYERGEVAVTTLAGKAGPDGAMTVSVKGPRGKYTGMPETRDYEIVFHHCAQPGRVLLDGNPVDAAQWVYDPDREILAVTVSASKGHFTVAVE